MSVGLSFFEVMRGELVDARGHRHPVAFELKAEASRLGEFLRAGHARLSGVMTCPPWVAGAPLSGALSISPIRWRSIAYRFDVGGADDAQGYRFVGHKDLQWWRPVSSMIRLHGQLLRGTEPIAEGLLWFDLRKLGRFVRSWWPSAGLGAKPLAADHRCNGLRLLSPAERRTWQALAEATIVDTGRVPALDQTTLDAAADLLGRSGPAAILAYRGALRWLETHAWIRKRAGFADLPLPQRRALLETLRRSPTRVHWRSPLPPLLVQLVSYPLHAAHYDRPDYHAAIGHPPARDIAPSPEPRYFRRVQRAPSAPDEPAVEAEVAVIGTGAGGAAVAATLAERGVAVAMVEQGQYHRREAFVGSPLQRMGMLWRHAGLSTALGTPLSIPLGRAVGGTTTINSGTCLPTPSEVLEHWRAHLGFPSDFAPDRFTHHLQRVRQDLRVQPGTPQALGRIAEVIARGCEPLGLAHGPLPRNAPGCTGAGTCIFGCPEGAKRSTDISYVPAALRHGAELYSGYTLTRLLKRGDRVVAIEAVGTGEDGRPRSLRVFAKRFVLACGAIQTPMVLRENGIDLPRIGRNLSVHPGAGLVGRMAEPLEPWQGIPQGYGFDGHGTEGIRFEGFYLPPAVLATIAPWGGRALAHWMDQFACLAQFGLLVRDGGDGWVRRGIDGQAIIGYRLSRRSQWRLLLGISVLAEVLLQAGAREVMIPLVSMPSVGSRAEARALRDRSTHRLDFRLLGAHPLGTCAMGASPAQGVVDFEHRVFGTDNLHVVDGSVVPTSLGVNPQMTIMAMALRAGHHIADLVDGRG